MEWIGFVALALVLYYLEKVEKLEKKMKKLNQKQKGGNPMSKMIMDLIGHRCKLYTDEALSINGKTYIDCLILDADEDWIKFSYTDKKNEEKTTILRIEVLKSADVLDQAQKETLDSPEGN